MISKTPFIIAIDGPAASGKGTISRKLAAELGLPHLDTGLTYRAVAHALMEAGEPLNDEAVAEARARTIDLGALDRTVLARHHIGEGASKVAVMSSVRTALVEQQRAFANSGKGAVLDGRDIGTVVCPDAQVKLYITASAEERARRRWAEIGERGDTAELATIRADIEARDARDMGREDSPLRPAEDAHLLDTSHMDIEAAFHAAMAFVERVRAS
ncbi:(d)CMP kinase [Ahrensia sp. R2A130]|uniref:(d)CMP kinase n=1 Tax=Ahrensia sp. R2A130 TaxID=744979 RepID=UPI0001E0F0CE|nr:(d)CMP kinase [Ahrensia sp. R2A130]EFL89187.1 cytidylate kinase [Ahrensia sp. R2A130]